MSISTETTATDQTTVAALEVDAVPFARSVENAALFAESGRKALPVLASVRIEYDGTTLTCVGTDRYQLAVDTGTRVLDNQNTPAAAPFAFLLPVDDVKRLVSHVTANVPQRVEYWPVSLTVDDGRLTVRTFDGSLTVRATDGEFPRWRSLLPEGDPQTGTERINLSPVFLAKYAKVTPDHGKRGSQPVKFTFYGSNKPAIVTIGETFRCLHMPIRQS